MSVRNTPGWLWFTLSRWTLFDCDVSLTTSYCTKNARRRQAKLNSAQSTKFVRIQLGALLREPLSGLEPESGDYRSPALPLSYGGESKSKLYCLRLWFRRAPFVVRTPKTPPGIHSPLCAAYLLDDPVRAVYICPTSWAVRFHIVFMHTGGCAAPVISKDFHSVTTMNLRVQDGTICHLARPPSHSLPACQIVRY